MTEHDVLERAAKALRSAHTGEHQGSGFTRARIMSSLHQNRRGRLYRWVIGAPIVSVLLVGSAWAQSTGKWPAVWAAVSAVFTAEPKPSDGTSSVRRTSESGTKSPDRAAPSPAATEPEPVPPEQPAPEPAPFDAPSLAQDIAPKAPEPSERPRTPRRAHQTASPPEASNESSSKSAATPEKPAQPVSPADRAADPELARFRAAHELHFERNQPRDAIAAYEAYLREFPRGRFVPEARYNMALDYIKLGDRARARQALRPFADGAFGDYRKREAEQLLEALR